MFFFPFPFSLFHLLYIVFVCAWEYEQTSVYGMKRHSNRCLMPFTLLLSLPLYLSSIWLFFLPCIFMKYIHMTRNVSSRREVCCFRNTCASTEKTLYNWTFSRWEESKWKKLKHIQMQCIQIDHSLSCMRIYTTVMYLWRLCIDGI